jgi:hypothetical protein
LENFHEIHCGFEDIYSIKKKNWVSCWKFYIYRYWVDSTK